MNGQVREWLPHGVVTRDAVGETIERAVADWSRRWFAAAGPTVSSMLPCKAEARTEADGRGWRAYGAGGVALNCSARGAHQLVARALDASIDRQTLADADRQLLEGFEARMLEDLARTLAQAVGADAEGCGAPLRVRDPFEGAGGVVVRVGEGAGADLVCAAVPFAALMPLCKSSLGPADRKPVRLDSLALALGSVPMTIEATLGRVDLGLADLQELAPGDVLVLDTGLNDLIQIGLPDASDPVARAKLVEVDGDMALVFH